MTEGQLHRKTRSPSRVPKASRAPREMTAYAAVSCNAGNTVTLIDTRTNHVVVPAIPVGPGPCGIAMAPDGRRVYVSNSGADSVSVIDVATRAIVDDITVGPNPAGLGFAPDGDMLYVALPRRPAAVAVVDLEAHRVADMIYAQPPCAPMGLAVTRDGRKAYVTSADNSNVHALDLETLTIGQPIAAGAGPNGVALSPRGRTAYITNTAAGSVTPLDVATDTAGPPIRVGLGPTGAAITPDGRFLYVANSGENTVSVIDTDSHIVASTIHLTSRLHPFSGPRSVAVTPDGRYVYVIETASHSVSVIEVATQQVTGTPIPLGRQPLVLGDFIGPNLIVPADSASSLLTIAKDRDLTTLGFSRFLPFGGGTLRLEGAWSTARTLSLLDRGPASGPGGGTIDTNGHRAALTGAIVGEGLLIKRGTGNLKLTGVSTNALGTLVAGGTLIVDGAHRGLITLTTGATLRGRGSVRDINLTAGTLCPGRNGVGTLSAENVMMSREATFAVTLDGLTASAGYGRLHVNGSATINGARLRLQTTFVPPRGSTFRILTNVTRGTTFAGLPEGQTIAIHDQQFRITYAGGDGSDVVLIAL